MILKLGECIVNSTYHLGLGCRHSTTPHVLPKRSNEYPVLSPKTARVSNKLRIKCLVCDLKKASGVLVLRCRCLSERATCHEQCLALANGRLLKENLAMVQNKWRWDSFWISGIILIKTCVYCEWLYLLIDKSNRQIHHIPCIYIEYRPNIHGQHLIIHILSVSYRRLCSLAWKLLPLMLTDHVLPIDGRASPLNDSPFHPTKAEQWCSFPQLLKPNDTKKSGVSIQVT